MNILNLRLSAGTGRCRVTSADSAPSRDITRTSTPTICLGHSLTRGLAAACLALFFLPSASAQLIPHIAASRQVCRLPAGYDYAPTDFLNTVSATTFRGVSFERSPVRDPRSNISTPSVQARHYSLSRAELRKNHCQLSDVAITLDETGRWSVSFLAENNPALTASAEQPRVSLYQQSRFRVRLRPLIGDANPGTPPINEVVAADATHIMIPVFTLPRGSRRRFHFEGGPNHALIRNFRQLQFVSVDLTWEQEN